MARRTSPYAASIAHTVPELDPRHVEAFMRVQLSTLDHLSPEAFRDEALTAAECVRADPGLADRLAETYGL